MSTSDDCSRQFWREALIAIALVAAPELIKQAGKIVRAKIAKQSKTESRSFNVVDREVVERAVCETAVSECESRPSPQ